MLARTLAVGVLVLLLAGCGSGEPEGTVKVTGKVTQDGTPLSQALVTFIPVEDTLGFGGSGATNAGGKYALTPKKGGKGIAPGEYKVTISRFLQPDGSPPDPRKPPIESKARETLPAIYSNPSTTTLKATVSKDAAVHDFQLQGPAKTP